MLERRVRIFVRGKPGQVQHRLTASETEELVADYTSGLTIEHLSSKYRLHRTTVMSALDRREIVRRPVVKLDETVIQQAIHLYTSGLSLANVAGHTGVDASTVANILRRHGVALRPRRGWPAST